MSILKLNLRFKTISTVASFLQSFGLKGNDVLLIPRKRLLRQTLPGADHKIANVDRLKAEFGYYSHQQTTIAPQNTPIRDLKFSFTVVMEQQQVWWQPKLVYQFALILSSEERHVFQFYSRNCASSVCCWATSGYLQTRGASHYLDSIMQTVRSKSKCNNVWNICIRGLHLHDRDYSSSD